MHNAHCVLPQAELCCEPSSSSRARIAQHAARCLLSMQPAPVTYLASLPTRQHLLSLPQYLPALAATISPPVHAKMRTMRSSIKYNVSPTPKTLESCMRAATSKLSYDKALTTRATCGRALDVFHSKP